MLWLNTSEIKKILMTHMTEKWIGIVTTAMASNYAVYLSLIIK